MDYGYSLPASNSQYEYVDDGLGGPIDDGLGSSFDLPQSNLPSLDEPALDYFDNFAEPAAPEPSDQQQQQQSPAPDQSGSQAADEAAAADDGGLDAELEAELDKAFGDEPAGDASRVQQQQQGAQEDSDVETVDEAGDSDGDDVRSREDSQQAEDPAQAEQQRQNAWYKECYDAMTEAQRNRLEAYNRSNLQRKTMRKVLQELTGSGSTNDKLLIALSAVTKMFVGELVSTARQIAACQGHTGALLPSHIRAAYQVLSQDGKVPTKAPSKPLRLR